jgi:hypothetical protein
MVKHSDFTFFPFILKSSLVFMEISTQIVVLWVVTLLLAFLMSALDGGEWSALYPGHFTPGGRAVGIHWIGGWMHFTAGLDAVEKSKFSADASPGI